jgi:hypothetical protein
VHNIIYSVVNVVCKKNIMGVLGGQTQFALSYLSRQYVAFFSSVRKFCYDPK